MSVSSNIAYRRKGDAIRRDVAGEALLVPIRGRLADMENLFVLEGAADFVWDRMDGKTTLAQILDAIVEAHEVGREEAGADLGEVVAQMSSAGLIEEAS